MYAERLVVICGAGLSMAPPSSIPSARAVAEACFDEYRLVIDPQCDPALRSDLEAFAEYFAALDTLQSVFIERLVPWGDFVRPPNAGHAALADFMIVGAATAVLSSNYDTLIEHQAFDYGFDFRSSLDGDEANYHSTTQGPLLKFHGCAHRDRHSTIWAPSQLCDVAISRRLTKNKTWMAANLRAKDFLILGFWSDWAYLNRIISSAMDDMEPHSVTLVDLASQEELERKAPELWAIANANHVNFYHVRESAAEFLTELRHSFSAGYLRQVLHSGRATFEIETGVPCDPILLEIPDLDNEVLYDLRRDSEGIPNGRPATRHRPENTEVVGFAHLLLKRAGAAQTRSGYELNGQTIRIVNGAGTFLASLQTKFAEAPARPKADVTIAAGATDLPVPGNIVRTGRVDDIIRPEASGVWLDLNRAREELGI